MVRAHPSAHAFTAQTKPVDYAIARIAAIRAVRPDAVFFLSSDSPEASAIVREHADVVELPEKGEFNSIRGVQDAVCDLYLLASCQWIVGSHLSSFSEIAGHLAPHRGYETAVQPAATPIESQLDQPRRLQPRDLWI
jgi:hypothetical protein